MIIQAPEHSVSPQFSALVKREGLNSTVILDAYKLVIEAEGLAELDFVRPAGASFNPRPARIGTIVILDCGVVEPLVVAAGILTCSKNLCPEALQRFPQKVRELLSPQPSNSPERLAILSAHWLDRARHLHLAPPGTIAQVYPVLAAELGNILPLLTEKSWPIVSKVQLYWQRLTTRFKDIGA